MSRLNELIKVVDNGTRVLKERARYLNEMICLLEDRRFEELDDLVEQVPDPLQHEDRLVQKISRLCAELAEEQELEINHYTLSTVIDELEKEEAMLLRDRRQRLGLAIDNVKERGRKLMEITLQMREVESRVLRAVLGPAEQDTTYCENGRVGRSCSGVAVKHKA